MSLSCTALRKPKAKLIPKVAQVLQTTKGREEVRSKYLETRDSLVHFPGGVKTHPSLGDKDE